MGQVVLLIGEPGLGKSRLVHTLKEHVLGQMVEGRRTPPVIEWRCSPHFQNTALYPAIEFYERALAFGREEPPQARFDRLLHRLEQYDLARPETVPLWASLLSLPSTDRFPPLCCRRPARGKRRSGHAGVAAQACRPEAGPVRRRGLALGLTQAEILYQKGRPPRCTYIFKHASSKTPHVQCAGQGQTPVVLTSGSSRCWKSGSPISPKRSGTARPSLIRQHVWQLGVSLHAGDFRRVGLPDEGMELPTGSGTPACDGSLEVGGQTMLSADFAGARDRLQWPWTSTTAARISGTAPPTPAQIRESRTAAIWRCPCWGLPESVSVRNPVRPVRPSTRRPGRRLIGPASGRPVARSVRLRHRRDPDRLERDLELIRRSRQFGALGDDEAAAVVVELHPAEQRPPSSMRCPGPIFIPLGSGRQVGQGEDGQVEAGQAAVVAVSRRVGPGRRARAPGHDVAVGDQAEGAALASQGGLVGLLAEAGEGEEAGQDQAGRDQRGEPDAQAPEAGADPALGRAQRQIEEVGDLLVGQVFEEGQAQRLALGRGRASTAARTAARRCSRQTDSAGPGSESARFSELPPSASDVARGLRPRRRSSLITRVWVMCETQARNVPRAGSKVAAFCQTVRKTSWVISSAVA